jgi:salicylate biosynthesis isochorismate synthase/menaquinone-specific isochorismate synthase
VLPELSLVRSGGETFLTLTAIAGGNAGAVRERLERRLRSLREEPLPMLDPSPTDTRTIASVLPPRHFEDAVAAGVERIRSGELDKVVLAREVKVEAASAHDPAAVFGALREGFPSCFCFCVGTPEAAFLGASPELLVRRRGAGVATVALAGSTRRSADPAIDDHLAEQLMQSEKNRIEHRIVSQRIARKLAPRAVWVEAADEPEVIKVANIQHLATPVHAQLADPVSAVDLAALLHPTPAVGGEPDAKAQALIGELEDMDRGWYAAPVGWMDAAEDGEFCVALRSALLRDRTARLFAGGGIVGDSDPEAELAETELKLQALLPLVSG